MRRTILIWSLSLFLWPLAANAAKPAEPPLPEAAERHARPHLADRDGDRVADGLQAALAKAGPDERIAVVVTFSGPGNAASAAQAVGPFDLRHEFGIIRGFAAKMNAAQIRALARQPGVFRVEEDFPVRTQLDAARADFGIEAARSEFGASGDGIGVCIVDTGADPTHEQLDGKAPIPFIDYVNGRTTAYDDHGHGTHVASIAVGDGSGGINAARYRGVAPAARLSAAKVLDAGGYGLDSNVILGVQWCAARSDVHIISLSLGSDLGTDGADALSQAVDAAVAAGKVVVVAAGNSGDAPASIGSPGAAAGAITVAACAEWSAAPGPDSHSDGVYLAPWSSRGPIVPPGGGERTKPDLCAPGHSITAARANSSGGVGYVAYSGTSMATPFVSGTVALALQENRALTPAAIVQTLERTAQDRGAAGKDNHWGAGLLDGRAFVAAALNQQRTTVFPTRQHVVGSVGDAPARWVHTFDLAAAHLGVPIAATIAIAGARKCALDLGPFGCWVEVWSPDLDAELYDPAGNRIAESGCTGLGDCGSIGQQETLHAMPTYAGRYRIEVYGAQDDVNFGQGGDFVLELSTGPLADGSTPLVPNFALAASPLPPANGTVTRGGSASYSVTVSPSGGFSGLVNLSVGKLPAGMIPSFAPDDVVDVGAGQPGSTLTVKTGTKTRRGTYTLTITGSSGSLSHSNTVQLKVQ